MRNTKTVQTRKAKGSYLIVGGTCIGVFAIILIGISAISSIAPVRSNADGGSSVGRQTDTTSTSKLKLVLAGSDWKTSNDQALVQENNGIVLNKGQELTTRKTEQYFASSPKQDVSICASVIAEEGTNLSLSSPSIKSIRINYPKNSSLKQICVRNVIAPDVATPTSPSGWDELKISTSKTIQLYSISIEPVK